MYTDLMTAAGMQTDAHQTGIGFCQADKLQAGLFDAFSFLFYHKNLVFAAVLEEKICPVSDLRGCPVDQGYIFLDYGAFLNSLG